MLNFSDFQEDLLTEYQAEHGVDCYPTSADVMEAWKKLTENSWHNKLQKEVATGEEFASLFRRNNLPDNVAYILIQGPRGYHKKGVYDLVIDDLDNKISGLKEFEVDQKIREVGVDPLIGW